MPNLQISDIAKYVEDNIRTFHQKRLKSLNELQLTKILKRKNPYLFKAKNILTAQDLVKTLLDAHLSSQEETIFGDFLEGLAIYICSEIYSGRKSTAEGIDLEFEKDDMKYLVSIKSGPNWGNSSQITKMRDNFKKAKKILGTNSAKINVICVNGCCYGRDDKFDKGEYLKLCGQRFWEFISGIENLYTELVEPLGHKARDMNDEFYKSYSQIINKFTIEFANDYCEDGIINWAKLVKLNSSKLLKN